MNTAPRGPLLDTRSVHGGASLDRPEGHAHETKRRGHHLRRQAEPRSTARHGTSGTRTYIAGCQAALNGFPMTAVDPAWLHVTIAQISDAVGTTTTEDELLVLKTELQVALRSIPPFTLMVGSCLSYHSGSIFDLSPDGELNNVRDIVPEVIGRVRGPGAGAYDPRVLHMSLAYASGDADSDVVQHRLRRVRPSHAPMTIRSLWLVKVASDPDAKTITWAAPKEDQELLLGG